MTVPRIEHWAETDVAEQKMPKARNAKARKIHTVIAVNLCGREEDEGSDSVCEITRVA